MVSRTGDILVESERLKQQGHTSDIATYTLRREGVEFTPKRWTILAEDLPEDVILGKQNLSVSCRLLSYAYAATFRDGSLIRGGGSIGRPARC
jgi:hypothetical protein